MILDIKKCDFSLIDGTGTPKTVALKVGEGTLQYTEKKAREYIKDKGLLDTVRDGDEDPMEVQFQFRWEFLISTASSVTPPTVEEALKKTGAAASWVSSAADLCEPYAVDIKVVYTPGCNGIVGETYLFPDFRYESLEHDFRAGTVSVQGMCNATHPTITRAP